MGFTNQTKQLIPRPGIGKAKLDVLVLVDGSSSVGPEDFTKSKQICNAISARMTTESQMGVIQFGSQAKLVSSLTVNTPALEKSIEAMSQIGGSTNLNAAFTICSEEFGLSKFPKNDRQVWLVTDGHYDDPAPPTPSLTALVAQKLKREKQVTIFAIGVGKNVTVQLLNKVASPGCSFLVSDYDSAFKIIKGDVNTKDLKCQLEAEIVLPGGMPMRLGEEANLSVKVENVGNKKSIPEGSRIIFKDNTYFKEKFAIISENIRPGEDITLKVKLVPKTRSNKANLDSQIQALPEVLELLVFDDNNNEIAADCTGFYLHHEDFTGDIFLYEPLYGVPTANIITFGPPGAGKSSFVNSACSALGDRISQLNVAGATREVVTSTLLQFPLYLIEEFKGLKFSLFDVPGVDGKNYQGEEMAMVLHGVLPFDVDFKFDKVVYDQIKDRRDPDQMEVARRAHVVAFFVPQGSAGDSDVMARLSKFLYQITVEHKRKAIVIISHADEISKEEDRKEILADVCQALSIDNSSVFFLENYVDKKDKNFVVDKQVLRILLAMISRTDDFLTYDRLNPSPNPFGKSKAKVSYTAPEPTYSSPSQSRTTSSKTPASPKHASPKPSPKPSPSSKSGKKPAPPPPEDDDEVEGGMEAFLGKLQDSLRIKVQEKMEEEDIDFESVQEMTAEQWKMLDFKMGDIMKIQKALKE